MTEDRAPVRSDEIGGKPDRGRVRLFSDIRVEGERGIEAVGPDRGIKERFAKPRFSNALRGLPGEPPVPAAQNISNTVDAINRAKAVALLFISCLDASLVSKR